MQNISKALLTSSVILLSAVGVAIAANKGATSPLIATQSTSSISLLAMGKTGPAISTTSGAAEIALAEHLKKSGVVMYGAFWCPYCHAQKQLFGAAAWSKVNYVECANGGEGVNIAACDRAGIRSFPTWRFNGKNYPGQVSLFKLAKISNYRGDNKFKNRI
jgi:thiol-disulfide isomerase/thioredoxin